MGMKQSMKLEYYTGEINSHVDYLKIIKMFYRNYFMNLYI